jgi:hypothetical protein
MGMFSRDPIDPPLRCSFCNKDHSTVQKLIAGPEVFICSECVEVCNDIIRADTRVPARATAPDRFPAAHRPPREDSEPVTAVEPPEPAADATTTVVTCALCRMQLPWEEAVTVPERGALCPGCVAAVEAAIAEQREGSA